MVWQLVNVQLLHQHIQVSCITCNINIACSIQPLELYSCYIIFCLLVIYFLFLLCNSFLLSLLICIPNLYLNCLNLLGGQHNRNLLDITCSSIKHKQWQGHLPHIQLTPMVYVVGVLASFLNKVWISTYLHFNSHKLCKSLFWQ